MAHADEPLFGYVFTTDLLPQGKYEIAQWATWRAGKPVGQFEVLEGRTELEYGVTDRFQAAVYFNYEWAHADRDNVIDGSTLGPSPLGGIASGSTARLSTSRFTGVSLEGIYRVLSPYTDPVGLAVYVRPTIGPSLRELETRLILQKNFLDDRWVVALNVGIVDDSQYLANVAGRQGFDAYEHAWTDTSSLNTGLATTFRFARNWSAGLELQNERAFSAITPFGSGSRTSVTYYAGPSIHYAGKHMFVTATYLDQLPFASDFSHTHPDFDVGGRNYGTAAERYRVRLKFGWYF